MSQKIDKSKLLFDNKYLVTLIIPLLIETLLNVTIGMMDTIMVSSNGEAVVSGVSLVDSLANLFVFVFSAFATGGAVVCSQYLGRKDKENAASSAKQLIYLSTTFAIVIMVFLLIFRESVVKFVFGSIEEDVHNAAIMYLLPIAVSFPFLAVTNSCNAICRSMGKSSITMMVALVMNLINVSGNAIMIYGMGLSSLGAGIASLLSRIVASIIMIKVITGKKQIIRITGLIKVRFRADMLKRIMRIALPSGIENGIFHIGKILVASTIASFGTASIAANAVFNSLGTFANIPGTAIGMASVTVIGQCCGAREIEQAKYYAKKLLALTYVLMGVTCVFMYITTPPLTAMYNLSDEANWMAIEYTRLDLIQTMLFWPLAFTIPNFLRAAGDVKYTMIVSICSMWLFRVLGANILGINLGMGLLGVFWAMFIDWYVRGVFFIYRWKKGVWTEKRVI